MKTEMMQLLREIEDRLESCAADVLVHPAGSSARERAEALYREASAGVRADLERHLPDWRDPLERELDLEALRRRQDASQARERGSKR